MLVERSFHLGDNITEIYTPVKQRVTRDPPVACDERREERYQMLSDRYTQSLHKRLPRPDSIA